MWLIGGELVVRMDDVRRRRWARVIDFAHRKGWLLSPISDSDPLSKKDAYAIQQELTRLRQARSGGHKIGWKIGYASDAMRDQMGIDRPNFGPLTTRMMLSDGVLSGEVTHPRAEPELAVVLRAALRPGATPDDVRGVVGEVRTAIEVVDSVWLDYQFRWEDNTADGSSAAAVVLGPALPPRADLAGVKVEMFRAGHSLGKGRGSDAMGHPFTAVSWLAAELAEYGEVLRAGDVIMTGGLTPAVPLRPGEALVATFDDLRCEVLWYASDG